MTFIFQWKVTKPLQDLEVFEMDEARFECVLSVANVIVTWMIDGKRVDASPKHMIEIDKKKHTFIITKCQLEDKCEVSCSYAKLHTAAKLVVKGKNILKDHIFLTFSTQYSDMVQF